MEPVTYPDGKTPNICIIGAGFSGLTAAIQLKRKLNVSSFTLFDENHEVGGTWMVNTYPGCACDIPSHLYSWSFELNPDWTTTFSSQEEIWTYMMATAQKYDLYRHIKFSTVVQELVWKESIKQWKVTVRHKETGKEQSELFDIVINGSGLLSTPNYPKEFENFKGPIMHSAEWDSTMDLENKIVGIVGSGSSAVQIIPSIAPEVKELHCYQRKPAWVKSKPLYDYDLIAPIRWILKYVPLIMWLFRCVHFLVFELYWLCFLNKSWAVKRGRESVVGELEHIVPDKRLQDKLIPNYQYGCKRVPFSNTYFQTFNQPHVQLHTEQITEVMDNKIITADGTSQRIDVLVLATGFSFQEYCRPMTIVGKDSTDILKQWKNKGPKLLYGIVGSDLPNFFIVLGPNSVVGHTSVIFMIECQVNFMIQIVQEMMKSDTRCVSVKPRAVDEHMQSLEEQFKKMVWGKENCGSLYAAARGFISALWPWSSITYWNRTRSVNLNQFEFTN